MWKRAGALTFIFLCTSAAWLLLGKVTGHRTQSQDSKLRKAVSQLWGSVQVQRAPIVSYRTEEGTMSGYREGSGGQPVKSLTEHPLAFSGSDIEAKLWLDYRKKGLLWYSTYRVEFSGRYLVKNSTGVKRNLLFEYDFPAEGGIYDDFTLSIGGNNVEELNPAGGKIEQEISLEAGKETEIVISYRSQGMDQWWYVPGSGVSQVQNFKLELITDFDNIDFRDRSISPTRKRKLDKGWQLTWQYSNLISGMQIGLELPRKLNPGPFVEKVSFFAPVSLFLFLFLMFIITVVKRVRIHPMNYFFISASFFSFHLLMSYMVDHVDIAFSFVLCSMVSIALVVLYMRLVTGMKFALLAVGMSQFVYLVLFSYTFFLEGYTGLAITICCIITLFVVMQLTGRIDWQKQLAPQQ